VHLEKGEGDARAALVTSHPIHVGGEQVTANVYDRARLRAGDVVEGPAIVTEMDSTTLVLPGHAAEVHPSGSLLINPVGAERPVPQQRAASAVPTMQEA
jgi:N-methylhydantoinase A